MFRSPGAIAFKLGVITVHWYGIIIAFAYIAGIYVAVKMAQKKGLEVDHVLNLSSYLLIGGIIGARLYYVLFSWAYFHNHLSEMFMLWNGGLSIHGGIIGGAIVAILYSKIHKIPLLKYADIFSYGLILGQAIGRWGNFFNSEAFGSPTNLPWKLYIPPENRPPAYSHYSFFHPAFLYESLWDIFVFIILIFFIRKKYKNYDGGVFFSYLILYSTGRFMIESLRVDSIYNVIGIPLPQIASIILILTGITGLYFVTVLRKPTGQRKSFFLE